MHPEYPWKRFLCPPTGNVHVDRDGFVSDPDEEHGIHYNPDLVSFDVIHQQRCVILLGEPGIGKSMAMKQEYERFAQQNPNAIYFDLRSYSSETLIVQDIFQSNEVQAWKRGQGDLYLFLDSFDECINSVPNLTAILVDRMRSLDLSRLYLRLASRTDAWTEPRKQLFTQLFETRQIEKASSPQEIAATTQSQDFSQTTGEVEAEDTTETSAADATKPINHIFEYEVVALRKVDVEKAAEIEGINAEEFLQEVDLKEASAFAARPVTLKFLIDLFKKDRAFPHSKRALYQKGCWMLCDEPSPYRASAGNDEREYEPEQYLAIASRMAAVSILSKKNAFHIGNPTEASENDVGISQICGGKEVMMGNVVDVDAGAIRQTIATGLFSSRGSNRFGWSHQTYAEYLAAEYLLNHAIEPDALISLLVHPEDPEGKIAIPLLEIAAWLAMMNQQVFRYILKNDPETLLRSDLSGLSDSERSQLVESLLKQYEERTSLDDIYLDMMGSRRIFRKLDHKNLGTQLSAYIFDRSKNIIVRRVAIDIAEHCKVIALQDRLADLALDQTEDYYTRIQASYAVLRIGNPQTISRLKPLATGNAGNDPDDELKGVGLKALWPDQITTQELFDCLTPSQRDNLVGAYSGFRYYDVAKHLKDSDIPTALNWLIAQPSGGVFNRRIDHLEEEILMHAWKLMSDLTIRNLVGRFVFDELADTRGSTFDHDSELRKTIKSDAHKRLLLIEAIIEAYVISTDNEATLFWTAQDIAQGEDANRFYLKAVTTRDPDRRNAWIELFNDVSSSRQFRVRIILAIFGRIFGLPFFNGQPLKDLILRLLFPKFLYNRLFAPAWSRRERDQMREIEEEDPPIPDPLLKILSLLDEFEAGDTSVWPQITDKIGLNDDGKVWLHQDITLLPRWKKFSEALQGRIKSAAQKFVLENDPLASAWVVPDSILNAGVGGYKGLHLVAKTSPAFVTNLDVSFWDKWATVLIAYPLQGKDSEKVLAYELIKKAYVHASTRVISAFLDTLNNDNRSGRRITKLEHIEPCFGIDGKLEEALSEKLNDGEMTEDNFETLFRVLLEHKVEAARNVASLLIEQKRHDDNWHAKCVRAAILLMRYAGDAGWPVIWPIFQSDSEFGKEVIEGNARSFDETQKEFCDKLSEDSIKDLYIWMVGQFPPVEDPEHPTGRAHAVGTREEVGNWRDGLLQYLTRKGTLLACHALEKIEQALPAMSDLRFRTILGRRSLRQNWKGLPTRSIIELATNPDKRLVQNSDELMSVLIESFDRLEKKLHGEIPAIRDIWDTHGKKYKPISEEEFSDYIVRHLQADLQARGIIANREVRIHRRERTDIHVSAVIPGLNEGYYSCARVIIEVKGCWHPDLKTAMEEQLRDRYLHDNDCTHGLYLVGWFLCDKWAKQNSRWKTVPKRWNIQTTKDFFKKQAEDLSGAKKLYAYVLDAEIH